MCTKCKISGHHYDSTQCSLYKDNTSVKDNNTEITKVNDDFVIFRHQILFRILRKIRSLKKGNKPHKSLILKRKLNNYYYGLH